MFVLFGCLVGCGGGVCWFGGGEGEGCCGGGGVSGGSVVTSTHSKKEFGGSESMRSLRMFFETDVGRDGKGGRVVSATLLSFFLSSFFLCLRDLEAIQSP